MIKDLGAPFNSTRCIRNPNKIVNWSNFLWFLSTPHGALGTPYMAFLISLCSLLSTPHGALGTQFDFCGFSWVLNLTFNSTRCIRNVWNWKKEICPQWWLSTPHGALGTRWECFNWWRKECAFNSTRCIRNSFLSSYMVWKTQLSTPHGALGTSNDHIN